MKELLLNRLRSLWDAHPVTVSTTAGGIFLGILVLVIGFWATFFLTLTGAAGFVIGRWFEADESRLTDFLERLDDVLRR